MESSDSREPSYYEVALTNRQVLVAFVALLTCMVAAFFSGVWIGRGGPDQGGAAAATARATPAPSAPEVDQLSFFSGAEAGARVTATPAPARPTPAATPAPTPRPTAAPATVPPPVEVATPAPTPAPTRTAAPAAAPATGTVFVQVYSSTNGARAKEIAAELRKAGFPVVLMESPSGQRINFRVRVGPFAARAEADAAAGKLRREHRLDTWVTETP